MRLALSIAVCVAVLAVCVSAHSADRHRHDRHKRTQPKGDFLVINHLKTVKAAKSEYDTAAKADLQSSCRTKEFFDYAMFCHKTPFATKLPDTKDTGIDCSKKPAQWDSCKKAFDDAIALPGPTKEESDKALAAGGEGHMYPKKDQLSKAKKLQAPAPAAKFIELKSKARRASGRIAAGTSVSLPQSGTPWLHRSISYCYDANAKASIIARFYQGMQAISGATQVRFFHADCADDGHKLRFTQVVGYANSYVGNIGAWPHAAISSRAASKQNAKAAATDQPINFDPAAFSVEAATHEVIHALGFGHSHQSSDRDSFVTILNPIAPGHASFAWCDNNVFSYAAGALRGVYDYNSIMHYPQYVGGTCGTAGGNMFGVPPPPLPKHAGNSAAIGPSAAPTATDIEAIDSVYGRIALH